MLCVFIIRQYFGCVKWFIQRPLCLISGVRSTYSITLGAMLNCCVGWCWLFNIVVTCLCSIYNCVECSTLILLCQCSFFGNFGNLIWCVCLTACSVPCYNHTTTAYWPLYAVADMLQHHRLSISITMVVLVKSWHYDSYDYTGLSLPEYDSHPGLKQLPSP